MNILKGYQYYHVLPLYHIKSLIYEAGLISLTGSLSLASFAHTWLVEIDYHKLEPNFTIILWILIALLSSKVYRRLIEQRLINLYFGYETKYSAKMLLHKVILSKQLKKILKLPGKETEKYSITYVLNTIEHLNLHRIFTLPSEPSSNVQDQISINQNFDKICFQYVEKLSTRFPQDIFVKSYLAYLGSKNPDLSLKTIGILTELKQMKQSDLHLSVILLLEKVQKVLITKNHNNDSHNLILNLTTYINSHIYVDQLKKEMLEQTELKIMICNNILGETSNIGKIHSCAQLRDKSKNKIQKKIELLSKKVPDCFIEPYLISAGYYLILDYSPENFRKYSELCVNKYIKFSKYFEDLSVNKENIYQDTNAFLIISADRQDNGQIIFCSDSIKNICGGTKTSYEKTHFSSLFTPGFRHIFASLFRKTFESGHTDLLDKFQRVYLQNKDGHMIEAELYMKVHPYLTQHLYVNMIIRPLQSTNECLLVKKNGEIEGATAKMMKILMANPSLNSFSKISNIKYLSEELFMSIDALNQKAKLDPKENSGELGSNDGNEAQGLDSQDTETQKIIELNCNPLGQKHLRYWNCKISTISCGSALMKLITLEEATEYNQQEERKKLTRDLSYNIDNKSDNIDALEMNERINLVTHNQDDQNFNTDTNCLVLTTINPLDSVATPREKEALLTKSTISPGVKSKKILFPDKDAEDKEGRFESSIGASFVSLEDKFYQTFHSTITTKSRPKSFKPLCLAFYFVISLGLVSQIVLKIVSDETLTDLVLKKDLLNYSQLRSYKAVLISINYRSAMGSIEDPLQIIPRGVAQNLSFVIPYASGYEPDLKNYNNLIMNKIALLDQDVSQKLLARDVRINGTFEEGLSPNYVNVSNFDAVEMIIDAMHYILNLPNYNSTECYKIANYIQKNILNDFLYKSGEITTIFQDSVRNQREYFQEVIKLFMIVTPLILTCIASVLIITIWNQYSIEKKQLLAFLKVDHNKVKDMLKRFKSFKRDLIGEKLPTIEDYWSLAKIQQGLQERSYRKSQHEQNIDYRDIRKKYYTYVLKVIFYILILIGVTTWNYVSAQNSTKVIYTRQSQLEFAGYISNTITTAFSATNELFNSNVSLIEHMYPPEAVAVVIAKITRIQEEIAENFKEEDQTYDPQIKTIVFDTQPCSYYNFVKAATQIYCTTLQNKNYLINLISLVNLVAQYVTQKVEDFEACDKSTIITRRLCLFQNLDYFLTSIVLSTTEAQMIGDIVGANLEKSVSDAYRDRNIFLAMFTVSLISVALLTWHQILRQLREVHNEFRKVLQIFPPDVILSSFLLKMFLEKNAKNFF